MINQQVKKHYVVVKYLKRKIWFQQVQHKWSSLQWNKLGTHYFFPGAQHSQFSKAHVERGALKSPIGLSDHDHVDAARQRGLIDPLVELLHRHQHLTRQLPHIVHGVHLPVKTLA